MGETKSSFFEKLKEFIRKAIEEKNQKKFFEIFRKLKEMGYVDVRHYNRIKGILLENVLDVKVLENYIILKHKNVISSSSFIEEDIEIVVIIFSREDSKIYVDIIDNEAESINLEEIESEEDIYRKIYRIPNECYRIQGDLIVKIEKISLEEFYTLSKIIEFSLLGIREFKEIYSKKGYKIIDLGRDSYTYAFKDNKVAIINFQEGIGYEAKVIEVEVSEDVIKNLEKLEKLRNEMEEKLKEINKTIERFLRHPLVIYTVTNRIYDLASKLEEFLEEKFVEMLLNKKVIIKRDYIGIREYLVEVTEIAKVNKYYNAYEIIQFITKLIKNLFILNLEDVAKNSKEIEELLRKIFFGDYKIESRFVDRTLSKIANCIKRCREIKKEISNLTRKVNLEILVRYARKNLDGFISYLVNSGAVKEFSIKLKRRFNNNPHIINFYGIYLGERTLSVLYHNPIRRLLMGDYWEEPNRNSIFIIPLSDIVIKHKEHGKKRIVLFGKRVKLEDLLNKGYVYLVIFSFL